MVAMPLLCAEELYASSDVPLDTLVAEYEFGGRHATPTVDQPSAVRLLPDGSIIITNTYRNNLLRFDPSGRHIETIGSIGSGDGEFNHPTDFRASGKRCFVADQSNKRVCVLDSEFGWLESVTLPVRVDQLTLCPDGSVYASCTVDKPGGFVYYHIDVSGELLPNTGRLIGEPTGNWHLRTAMNVVLGCWIDSSTLVTVFSSLAAYSMGASPDDPGQLILVPSDVRESRQHFYENNSELFGSRLVHTSLPISITDLVDDLVHLNQGRGRFSEYVSDICQYRDGFLLAVSSVIHEYDRNGKLCRRCVLLDGLGNRAYASSIAVDSDDRLFALDCAYTFRCRVFRYGQSGSGK